MVEVLLGVGSSLLTEAAAWVNSKLSNTPLAGDGAYIVSIGVALLVALAKTAYAGELDLTHVATTATEVWAVSQVWYQLIASKMGLTVKQ